MWGFTPISAVCYARFDFVSATDQGFDRGLPSGRTLLRDRFEPDHWYSLPDLSDRCDRPLSSDAPRFWPIQCMVPSILISANSTALTPLPPMSPSPTSQTSDTEPGQLLKELEQRQDEVLQQLDELDTQLQVVLHGLGVTIDEPIDQDLV